MSINAEVQKSGNESTLSTIRKFSRRVQGTGIVKAVRGGRYFARAASKTVKKKRALKLLKRHEEYRRMVKEGKIIEEVPRGLARRDAQRQESPQGRIGDPAPIAR